MRRLDNEPLRWRYGITLRGLWLASNGQWVRDSSHPSVQYWPTMEQARAWRERHMPGQLGAWAEAIGIFQGGVNVTAVVHNEGLVVYRVHPDGVLEVTHHPDHWGLPAWCADMEVRDVGCEDEA